jgi:hypothetical protein
MKNQTFLVLLVLLIVSCSPSATPTPTPDLQATETKIAANIFATQTASMPTATNTPTNTTTPTVTDTPTNTATPTITQTPRPTDTPRPTNTPTPAPTLVTQDNPVTVDGKWQITLVSARRDKTIYGPYGAETAFGVWASLLFRVKNLQGGSDYIGKTFSPVVFSDSGAKDATLAKYSPLNTVEDKATWFYSCCDSAFHMLSPGQETVVLYTLDVPENTKNIAFLFYRSSDRFSSPTFFFPDFDQVPPRKMK